MFKDVKPRLVRRVREPDRLNRRKPHVIIQQVSHVQHRPLLAHGYGVCIAFAGSTATAKQIMRMASGNLKNITLESGGKSPLIVFDDADLDLAAHWAHAGIMSTQGQVCSATSRVLVQAAVYDEFLERFRDKVTRISTAGDPFDEGTFQGPQVSRAQLDRVLTYTEVGRQESARLELGGGPFEADGGKGVFVEPTVFSGVSPR